MQKSLTAFLREAAALLRDLPNELRRFADDLDKESERAARKDGSREATRRNELWDARLAPLHYRRKAERALSQH